MRPICAKPTRRENPLENHSLDGYRLFKVELTKLTRAALKDLGLDTKSMDRCKNFFALGMCYWLYNRSMEPTERWLNDKFKSKPILVQANLLAMKAGYGYCDASESFQVTYDIPPAKLEPGLYRNISGNAAIAIGFVAASQKANVKLFLGSYPITPASDILHELSMYKDFGVMTFQAEDEIAAITAAIGAAYARRARHHHHFRPRHGAENRSARPCSCGRTAARRSAIFSAAAPPPVCRRKPSKPILLQALFGRNSEAPIPVLAPSSPGDCFWIALEASRIAIKYMVPVIVLSDGYLANGAEPWKIPTLDELPEIPVKYETNPEGFQPYKRNPDTLARPWAIPGTPGLEHRVGGIEKQDVSGNISYDPLNHEHMVRTRAEKVARIAQDIPDLVPEGDAEGDLLIVAWGSTSGPITAAMKAQRAKGRKVGHVHLRHLNPLPRNLGEVMRRYKKVLVPEMNMGQLVMLLRAKYLVDAHQLQ